MRFHVRTAVYFLLAGLTAAAIVWSRHEFLAGINGPSSSRSGWVYAWVHLSTRVVRLTLTKDSGWTAVLLTPAIAAALSSVALLIANTRRGYRTAVARAAVVPVLLLGSQAVAALVVAAANYPGPIDPDTWEASAGASGEYLFSSGVLVYCSLSLSALAPLCIGVSVAVSRRGDRSRRTLLAQWAAAVLMVLGGATYPLLFRLLWGHDWLSETNVSWSVWTVGVGAAMLGLWWEWRARDSSNSPIMRPPCS